MGVVYKGRDPEIGRLVAIKTLKSVYLGNDPAGNEALQRFRQEARSAGKLHHPNIVTIFEAGRTETGSPYIVMEFIEGTSVELLLTEQGPLDPFAVLHYLAQIASAVDYAHSQNVIHRDLKPSNILVDGWHRAHLLDFGVAKLSDTSLTPAGTVVGTPSYMSPEQIRGQTLDGRTDLFSLAVVAYEALTGVRPFPGNDFTTVVTNIIHKEPLSFSEVKSDLPAELEKVLRGGLAKEKEERCSSALEFVSGMARIFDLHVDGAGLVGGYSASRKWRNNGAEVSQTVSRGVAGGVGSLGLGRIHEGERESTQQESERSEGVSLSPAAEVPASQAAVDQAPLHEPLAGKHDEYAVFNNEPTEIKEEGPKRRPLFLGVAVLVIVLCLAFVAYRFRAKLLLPGKLPAGEPVPVALSGEESGEAAQSGGAPAQEAAEKKAPVQTEETGAQSPPGGYTREAIAALSDDELLVLLSWKGTDADTLRLAVPEAGVRAKKEFGGALRGLLQQKDLVIRVEALKALNKPVFVQDEEVIRDLAALLDDPEPVVRGFAAKAMANAGTAGARELLEARLKTETSEVVQKVIKDCLTRMVRK